MRTFAAALEASSSVPCRFRHSTSILDHKIQIVAAMPLDTLCGPIANLIHSVLSCAVELPQSSTINRRKQEV